jgi:DNA-binding CsgD family transcriptional regulator
MSVSTETLLGAVAPLHEAPQDTEAWQRALNALARTIPCGHATLVERVGSAASADLGLVAGTDARFLDEYQREFHRLDPFARADVVSQLNDLGRVTHSRDVLGEGDLQRSAFYQQFLSRHGDLFHGLGGAFSLCDSSHAQLWLLRPRGQRFDDDERRRLDVFFAHARAAMRQRRWLLRIKRERDAALAWMDCWGDATFVLDAEGGLLIANVTGERVLRAGQLLALQDRQLRSGKLATRDWLAHELAELVKERRVRGVDATRCVALKNEEGLPLYAVLTVLQSAQAATPMRIGLILRDPRQARPQPDARQLHDLFGFTTAEARVANALLAGQSVETIAREAEVRRDTVRAHVKRMLAKTGTHRQSDLLKLLVKTLPNLRSLSGVGSNEGVSGD